MEILKEHLSKLGRKCKCRVTGLEGVATSISFDLTGCIQMVIKPPASEGKMADGVWVDLSRIEFSSDCVMESPDFFDQSIANGEKGPSEKPVR